MYSSFSILKRSFNCSICNSNLKSHDELVDQETPTDENPCVPTNINNEMVISFESEIPIIEQFLTKMYMQTQNELDLQTAEEVVEQLRQKRLTLVETLISIANNPTCQKHFLKILPNFFAIFSKMKQEGHYLSLADYFFLPIKMEERSDDIYTKENFSKDQVNLYERIFDNNFFPLDEFAFFIKHNKDLFLRCLSYLYKEKNYTMIKACYKSSNHNIFEFMKKIIDNFVQINDQIVKLENNQNEITDLITIMALSNNYEKKMQSIIREIKSKSTTPTIFLSSLLKHLSKTDTDFTFIKQIIIFFIEKSAITFRQTKKSIAKDIVIERIKNLNLSSLDTEIKSEEINTESTLRITIEINTKEIDQLYKESKDHAELYTSYLENRVKFNEYVESKASLLNVIPKENWLENATKNPIYLLVIFFGFYVAKIIYQKLH